MNDLRESIAAIFAEDDDFVCIGPSSYEKADRVIDLIEMADAQDALDEYAATRQEGE